MDHNGLLADPEQPVVSVALIRLLWRIVTAGQFISLTPLISVGRVAPSRADWIPLKIVKGSYRRATERRALPTLISN